MSAGSNPAGGTVQRHKNTRTILNCPDANPVTCGNDQPFRAVRPMSVRKADTSLERACSVASDDNGLQAVAVIADRCSSQYLQLRRGSVGIARARLIGAPGRLDATSPTSHFVMSAPHSWKTHGGWSVPKHRSAGSPSTS